MEMRPSLARSLARSGPTPGRSASGVSGPGVADADAAAAGGPVLLLAGVNSLLRSRDHALKGPRVRQTRHDLLKESAWLSVAMCAGKARLSATRSATPTTSPSVGGWPTSFRCAARSGREVSSSFLASAPTDTRPAR